MNKNLSINNRKCNQRKHAHRTFDRFAEVGVDYDDIVAVREREGVQKFADSFRELVDGVAAKRDQVVAA